MMTRMTPKKSKTITTSMDRKYNFGAGPAMLPEVILKEAQAALFNWKNKGMSILEIGHRTPEFMKLMDEAEQDLRDLLKIPSEYLVLFLGGPTRLQFSMIPMNFMNEIQTAGYLVTGLWSSTAYKEAIKLKKAYPIASSEAQGFSSIPSYEDWNIKNDSAYLYFTSNETVQGIKVNKIPYVEGIPLIADMTSSLLTEPVQVTDYDLIFAGVQKNIANAGLTLVIMKNSLLEKIEGKTLPTMFDYRTYANHKMYATPPLFNCYLASRMFKWLKRQGGVEGIYEQNRYKSTKLYNFIDASSDYICNIEKDARSLVNVCFNLKDPSLEKTFIEQAKQRGLLALQGHRSVGGIRASLYNAMPLEGVEALIHFMSIFAKHTASRPRSSNVFK